MSKDLDKIKNALKYSTTMPMGSGGANTGAWLMGSGHVHGPHCNHGPDEDCDHDHDEDHKHHHHDHEHKDDGSCCDSH